MAFMLLLERILPLIPLIEGIEEETVGAAGGAPGNPEEKKEKAKPPQSQKELSGPEALQQLYARHQSRQQEPKQLSPEEIKKLAQSGKQKVPATAPSQPKKQNSGELTQQMAPNIKASDSPLEIRKKTNGERNNSAYPNFEDWMVNFHDVIQNHLYPKMGDPNSPVTKKYELAARALERGLEKNDDWLRTAHKSGKAWDDTFLFLVHKKIPKDEIGPWSGRRPYLHILADTVQNGIVNDVRNKWAEYQDQQGASTEQSDDGSMKRVFNVPADETRKKKYFQKFMSQIKSMFDMYYGNDPELSQITEDDWNDLENFLASPTPSGPMFQELQKKFAYDAETGATRSPEEFYDIIVKRMRKNVRAHQTPPEQAVAVDPNDPKNRQVSRDSEEGEGPNQTRDSGKVTALAKIPQPKMADTFNKKKRVYDEIPGEEKKFPSWWQPFGFKGDIPFSKM